MRYRLIPFLLVGFIVPIRAQTVIQPTNTWGTWLIGTAILPGSSQRPWGLFGEVQARGNNVLGQYFYNELKGGISYDLDRNITAMVAGGRYQTNDYKDVTAGPLNVEKRLWEQLVLNQYLNNRLRFEHRYRLEQRWFSFRDGTTEYRNRIRYRLNLFLPINHKTFTDHTWFVSSYDEIFLNPHGPTFERNRFYAGMGYQPNNRWIWQAGWVIQTNYSAASFAQGQFVPSSAAGKNNLVIGVLYRILTKTPTQERLPSQPD